jgi:hypothetical protein
MRHAAGLLGLVLILVGCQVPAERLPLMPLAEDGQPQKYADVITRASAQAAAANEALYVKKNWNDLEESAKALEETVKLLRGASNPPAKIKDRIDVDADDLAKEATRLKEAAQTKNEEQAIQSISKIQEKIHKMQP